MLVLSRRMSEKLIFPSLGITIEILKVGHSLVKLGVIAPQAVTILRGEIADDWCDRLRVLPESERHEFRNRLNGVSLRVHLIQRHLQLGQSADTVDLLSQLLTELRQIEHDFQATALAGCQLTNRRVRVLVVDDDTNERELLAGLLALYGFQVETAGDGDEALKVLSCQQLPHCVLLDINMPRVDGYRVLRSIRSDLRYRHLSVFAVSAEDAQPDLQLPGGLKGFDDWFRKPLDPCRLISTLADTAFADDLMIPCSTSVLMDDADVQEQFHELC